MTDQITTVLLSILIGTLASVVYALRAIVQMNQKLDKIAEHMGIKD